MIAFARLFSGLLLLAAVLSPDLAAAADRRPSNKDVIEYRRHIMNNLNEQSGALGMILSAAIPADNAGAHLQALALTAATALKAFEPHVEGGEARPEVWARWDDFASRMNDFAEKTAAAARIAQEKGSDLARATILDALTCKSCHDTYRDEKQK